MPKPIHITTPWPAPEEEARRYRIPKRRQKELRAMAEKFVKSLQEPEEPLDKKAIEKGKKRKDAAAAA